MRPRRGLVIGVLLILHMVRSEFLQLSMTLSQYNIMFVQNNTYRDSIFRLMKFCELSVKVFTWRFIPPCYKMVYFTVQPEYFKVRMIGYFLCAAVPLLSTTSSSGEIVANTMQRHTVWLVTPFLMLIIYYWNIKLKLHKVHMKYCFGFIARAKYKFLFEIQIESWR